MYSRELYSKSIDMNRNHKLLCNECLRMTLTTILLFINIYIFIIAFITINVL
jgi:hypothetical protein